MDIKSFLDLIDNHKNKLIDPVEMLHWTYLRLIVSCISDEAWQIACKKAEDIASK